MFGAADGLLTIRGAGEGSIISAGMLGDPDLQVCLKGRAGANISSVYKNYMHVQLPAQHEQIQVFKGRLIPILWTVQLVLVMTMLS